MTIPIWMLLAFAAWTLITLISSVGVARWTLMLTKRARPKDFRADEIQGTMRYRRSMRAHANCVENLPIFAAVIFAIYVSGIHSSLINVLAIIFMIARICQTLIHIIPKDSDITVAIRFTFFFIQIVIMIWMGIYVLIYNL